MFTTALLLPISQYYWVTMAAISGIYLKRAYSSNLQHRSLVKVQPSGSQTLMRRGPLLSLTGEYLIYCDTWVVQYHRKLHSEFLCSWPPVNHSVTPSRAESLV